jgi:hypothetical protein
MKRGWFSVRRDGAGRHLRRSQNARLGFCDTLFYDVVGFPTDAAAPSFGGDTRSTPRQHAKADNEQGRPTPMERIAAELKRSAK